MFCRRHKPMAVGDHMKYLVGHRVEPSGLSRRDKNHGYEFYTVTYQLDTPDQKPDFKSILYFRNADCSIYGMIDYNKFATSQNIRAIAAKLVKDRRFRAQFIAAPHDDDMLTSNWR